MRGTMNDQASCSCLKLNNKFNQSTSLHWWKTRECHLLCDAKKMRECQLTRERWKPYRILQWAFWKPYSKENKTLQNLTVRKIKPYRTLHSTSVRLGSLCKCRSPVIHLYNFFMKPWNSHLTVLSAQNIHI